MRSRCLGGWLWSRRFWNGGLWCDFRQVRHTGALQAFQVLSSCSLAHGVPDSGDVTGPEPPDQPSGRYNSGRRLRLGAGRFVGFFGVQHLNDAEVQFTQALAGYGRDLHDFATGDFSQQFGNGFGVGEF